MKKNLRKDTKKSTRTIKRQKEQTKMVARQDYGPIQLDHDYRVIEEGYDWVKVSAQGKAVCTPKAVFYGVREMPKYQEERED